MQESGMFAGGSVPLRDAPRCRSCGKVTVGGWTECPDGFWRDLTLDPPSNLFVDDVVPPRYVLEPKDADLKIVCDECDTEGYVHEPEALII